MLSEVFEDTEIDNRKKFREYMLSHGVTISSAARCLDITMNHLRMILLQDRKLKEAHRLKLNEYLGTDF